MRNGAKWKSSLPCPLSNAMRVGRDKLWSVCLPDGISLYRPFEGRWYRFRVCGGHPLKCPCKCKSHFGGRWCRLWACRGYRLMSMRITSLTSFEPKIHLSSIFSKIFLCLIPFWPSTFCFVLRFRFLQKRREWLLFFTDSNIESELLKILKYWSAIETFVCEMECFIHQRSCAVWDIVCLYPFCPDILLYEEMRSFSYSLKFKHICLSSIATATFFSLIFLSTDTIKRLPS